MIDFPASPTVGQMFTAAGVTWTWDGVKWALTPGGGIAITVSDTPPPSPAQGQLWWESVGGQMYLFYNDGNSSQWVPTTNQMGGGYMPLQGVTNGSDAPPGQIGEVISSVVTTGVSLTTSVPVNITSIPLTAGDWDVCGDAWITVGTGGATQLIVAIGPTSGNLGPGAALNSSRFQLNVDDDGGQRLHRLSPLPRQCDGDNNILFGGASRFYRRDDRHWHDLGEAGAMIDFPASPTNGQVFVSGAQSWTFDGTKWVASGNAVMPPLSTGDNRHHQRRHADRPAQQRRERDGEQRLYGRSLALSGIANDQRNMAARAGCVSRLPLRFEIYIIVGLCVRGGGLFLFLSTD